jgi:hypothetical protein
MSKYGCVNSMSVSTLVLRLSRHSVLIIFAALIFMFVFYFSSQLVFADVADPRIYTNNTQPYGIPYNQWAAKWWQWTQSIPGPVHPRDHPSEQNCKIAQQGPVWFLADLLNGTQGRACTIPASKSIFVSLVGGFCGSDSPSVTNNESLRQCAVDGDNYATVQATLDGKEIKNLDQYRIRYGPFVINYGNNNIYGHKAGTARGDVDGYYLFLKPLPPGQHVLDLKTSILNPEDSSHNYSADLIYHITTQ